MAQRQAITDLCTAWGVWQREANCIAAQGGQGRAGRTGPTASYMDIVSLHTAIQLQPRSLDRRVFELYYLHAVCNIKCEAARLGISRVHFYRLLWAFQGRVYRMANRVASSLQGAEA